MITTAPERFVDVVFEIAQLVEPHWAEVGSFKEQFQRDINYAAYEKLEHEGRLLTVTMRDDDGHLAGYFVGVMGADLHRVIAPGRRAMVLSALVYFVVPHWRGHARSLIKAVEREALERGIHILNIRVKPGANAADAFLSKLGYQEVERTYTRVLGARADAAVPTAMD